VVLLNLTHPVCYQFSYIQRGINRLCTTQQMHVCFIR